MVFLLNIIRLAELFYEKWYGYGSVCDYLPGSCYVVNVSIIASDVKFEKVLHFELFIN